MVAICDAEVCYVGGSSSHSNQGDHHWSWSLTGQDACKCTKIMTSNGVDITSSALPFMRDHLKCGTFIISYYRGDQQIDQIKTRKYLKKMFTNHITIVRKCVI